MSLIGIDFGAHTLSISLYYDDKDLIEVIADDLGSRTIPCCVAFRNDEILTGQAAISQQHKNHLNTFDDIRSMILKITDESNTINVPNLEKDIPIIELGSHFFRNVCNQVKQQVGKQVKDCIISIPDSFDDQAKARLIKSAQGGGLRIKDFIDDSISVLLAYNMDDSNIQFSKAVVVDMGWSKSVVTIFEIRNGSFTFIAKKSCKTACGQDMVRILSEHCAKDFQRKTSIPCLTNTRAMMRLRAECEVAMKSLSTAQEVTVAIDSLCEGADYSGRISRAKFEDLCSLTFMSLRNVINETVASVPNLVGTEISHVLMSGGIAAMPRVQSTVKAIFTSAIFPKTRLDPAEAQCQGAALHGKQLLLHKRLDDNNINTLLTELPALNRNLYLSGTMDGSGPFVPVLVTGCLLPVSRVIETQIGSDVSPAGYGLLLSMGSTETCSGNGGSSEDMKSVIGVIRIEGEAAATLTPVDVIEITLHISVTGAIQLTLKKKLTNSKLASLEIAAAVSTV